MSIEPSTAGHDATSRERRLLDFAAGQSSIVYSIGNVERGKPFSYISKNVETLTGHKVEDFLRDAEFSRQFIHPDDVLTLDASMDQLVEKGSCTREFRFRRADGQYRWAREELQLTADAGGAGAEYMSCISDVTAEKEAQRQLQEAESERQRIVALLQEAVDSLPNAFCVVDDAERILVCNTAFAEPFDKSPDALIGTERREVLSQSIHRIRSFAGRPVQGSQEDLDFINEALSGSDSATAEVELENDSWVLVNSVANPSGGRVYLRTDITSQKRAETALRESEEQLRSILESQPMAVWMADVETGNIIYESPAAAELVGRAWSKDPQRDVR
ncbi:MAG: PAS domain S-box protein, partial [Gammaproteobacteria bacterium]|nr:PAS domain S-box protein [Gammaproteobacteria bacterium]